MKIRLTQNQNIFFTSDFHWFHNNVLKFDNRPFNDINHMHDTIISNWNNNVHNNDIVFYMGDLSFGSINNTIRLFKQLKGKIYFILGNHDKLKDIQKLPNIVNIADYIELSIEDSDAINSRPKNIQKICLSHYPIISWNGIRHGSIMLHGHCHQNLVDTEIGNVIYQYRIMDVGCNGHNYTPLSYDDIKDLLKNRKILGHNDNTLN